MVYLTTLAVDHVVQHRLIIVKNELKRMWKETIASWLERLSLNDLEALKKTIKSFNQDSPN
jgi:hypothetical protein